MCKMKESAKLKALKVVDVSTVWIKVFIIIIINFNKTATEGSGKQEHRCPAHICNVTQQCNANGEWLAFNLMEESLKVDDPVCI